MSGIRLYIRRDLSTARGLNFSFIIILWAHYFLGASLILRDLPSIVAFLLVHGFSKEMDKKGIVLTFSWSKRENLKILVTAHSKEKKGIRWKIGLGENEANHCSTCQSKEGKEIIME